MNPNEHHPLYTIGHSNTDFNAFMSLLKLHGIEALADVRSSPYSRRFPQFSMKSLKCELTAQGIIYVYVGSELGARPPDPKLYVEGSANYELIAQSPLFQKGLERVIAGWQKYRLALLCSEKDPLFCHRAILICRSLRTLVPAIEHILYDGSLENHHELEHRLLATWRLQAHDLFLTSDQVLAKAYNLQAQKLSFRKSDDDPLKESEK